MSNEIEIGSEWKFDINQEEVVKVVYANELDVSYENKKKRLSSSAIKHFIKYYTPHIEEPKYEWIYECIGSSNWHFNDGHYPFFSDKKKSTIAYTNYLKRKTGRKAKLNMETYEIIEVV